MYFMDDSLFSAPPTGPSVLAVEAAAAFSTSLLLTLVDLICGFDVENARAAPTCS